MFWYQLEAENLVLMDELENKSEQVDQLQARSTRVIGEINEVCIFAIQLSEPT